MIELSTLVPFFAGAWFFAAAVVFVYKARAFPRRVDAFYPITGYLVGIAVFFLLQGWRGFRETALICPDALVCSDLGAGVAVMAGAAFVGRFPLKTVVPRHADHVFAGLVAAAIVVQVYLAFAFPGLVLAVAHLFALVVAGVAAVGYLVYRGLSSGSTFDWSLGVALAPCCVVAHGLAGLGFAAVVTLPLVGIPLEAPTLFAVLAPASVVGVLGYFSVLENEADDSTTPSVAGEVAIDGGTSTRADTVADPTAGPMDGDVDRGSDENAPPVSDEGVDDATEKETDGPAPPDVDEGWPPSRNPETVRRAIEAVESCSDERFRTVFGTYLDALEQTQIGEDDGIELVFLGVELGDGETPTVEDTSAVRYVIADGADYRFVGEPEPPDIDLELHLPPQFVTDGRKVVLDHLQCQLRDLESEHDDKSSIYTLLDGVGKEAVDGYEIEF